jgi:hypothetical protein
MATSYSPFRKGGDKGPLPTRGELPTLLQCAVWCHDVDAVREEIARAAADGTSDAVLNALTYRGNTVLHLAISLGYLDIARLLIEAGANILLRDCNQRPTIHGVVVFGHDDRAFALGCLRHMESASQVELTSRLQQLSTSLAGIPDFSVQLNFQFTSWVPLVRSCTSRPRGRVLARVSVVPRAVCFSMAFFALHVRVFAPPGGSVPAQRHVHNHQARRAHSLRLQLGAVPQPQVAPRPPVVLLSWRRCEPELAACGVRRASCLVAGQLTGRCALLQSPSPRTGC